MNPNSYEFKAEVLRLLTEARVLLDTAFTTGWFGKDSAGNDCGPQQATCFCSLGAVYKVAGAHGWGLSYNLATETATTKLHEQSGVLYPGVGPSVAQVNDKLGKPAALRVYDAAIAEATREMQVAALREARALVSENYIAGYFEQHGCYCAAGGLAKVLGCPAPWRLPDWASSAMIASASEVLKELGSRVQCTPKFGLIYRASDHSKEASLAMFDRAIEALKSK